MSGVWDEMDAVTGRIELQARREQEAAEAEAQQLHLASRSLTDVAWEAMQQGLRVHLRWIGGELAGLPIAAVGDLVVMRTDEGAAGINAEFLGSVETIGEEADRGSAGDRTVESFIAWCRMIEARPVRVAVIGGSIVDGTLAAVASDHLLLRTRHGNEIAVARTQVAAVSVAGDPFLAL